MQWMPQIILVSLIRGLVASNLHRQSLVLQGNLRAHHLHDASGNTSTSVTPCFTSLTPGYQLETAGPDGHNDISNRLGGRKLVKTIPECREHCVKYDCASLEVHVQREIGPAGSHGSDTLNWACWLSSTRANTFMGGKMERVKTDGWYYQEVCQQPSDQSIDLTAADQKATNKVAADKAAMDKLIVDHESGARLARQQAEAERLAANKAAADREAAENAAKDKLLAEQLSAQQAAESKAAADKAAAEKAAALAKLRASCSVKVGDEVQLMSDGAKLDKIYAKQGIARMLSTGAKGTVAKLERKGPNEGNGRIRNSMVKIKREGKEYWIPTKALAGFDNCEKVYVQAA